MKNLIIKEEQIDKISNLLCEISLEDAMGKFYSDIDSKTFFDITSMDASGGQNMTPLRNWLLSQYRLGNINAQTLPLYKEACDKYNALPAQTKNKLSNRFKSKAQDTFKNIEDFKSSLEELRASGDDKTKAQKNSDDTIIIYEDEQWIVLIPKTYKASYKWCQSVGAHWCTGAGRNGQYDGAQMFDKYTHSPLRALVMFLDKTDRRNAYQIAQTVNGKVTDCMDHEDEYYDLPILYESIPVDGLENMVNAAVKKYLTEGINDQYEGILKRLAALNKWDNVEEKWNLPGQNAWYDMMEDCGINVQTQNYGNPIAKICEIGSAKYVFFYDNNYHLVYYGPVQDTICYNGMMDGGFIINQEGLLVHTDISTHEEEVVYNKPINSSDIYAVNRLDKNLYSLRARTNFDSLELKEGLKHSPNNLYLLISDGNIVGDTSFKEIQSLGTRNVVVKIVSENLKDDWDFKSNIYDAAKNAFVLDNDKYSKCTRAAGANIALCQHKDDRFSADIYLPGYGMTKVKIRRESVSEDWEHASFGWIVHVIDDGFIDALLKDNKSCGEYLARFKGHKLISNIKGNETIPFYFPDGTIAMQMNRVGKKWEYIIPNKMNESKKKKHKTTPSIYDQMKGKCIDSRIMSMAQGDCGMLGEDATQDEYQIGFEGGIPNDLEYAHVVNEDKLYAGIASPDTVQYKRDNGDYINVNVYSNDARAFCYVDGKMAISEPGCDHRTIMDKYDVKNTHLTKCGRLWIKRGIITFWDTIQGKMSNGHNLGCNMNPQIMKKVVTDLQNDCGIDCMNYDYAFQPDDEEPVHVIPVRDYIRNVKDAEETIDVPTEKEYNSMENDPMYRMFVAEERGVNLSDDTENIDSLIESIIKNLKNWETPENQIEIVSSNPAYGIGSRYDIPKTSSKMEMKRQAKDKDGNIFNVVQRRYQISLPKELTSLVPYAEDIDISIIANDYASEKPEMEESLMNIIKNYHITGGYGGDWKTNINSKNGKTNHTSLTVKLYSVNGKLANPSEFYGIMYHELGHGKDDNIRMNTMGAKGRLGANSVDYWSHRHNSELMSSSFDKIGKAFSVLIYRLWEPDEMNQGSAQIFGDLKGLKDSDRQNFQNAFKDTATGKEWEILKQAYQDIDSNREKAQKIWNTEIVPKFNDTKGFLRFRNTASLYNKKSGEWYNVHPRKDNLSFENFMKETKNKMENYIKNIGRSASLYYDKEEENMNENTNPSSVDLSSFAIQDDLNAQFWKNDKLDSRIRMKLLDIADDFIEFLAVDWVKPKDIIMTGSLANYNWSKKYSDIDLHIIMNYKDVDKRTDFVEEYFHDKKSLWNAQHENLKIFGFPVEVYVQDTNAEAVQGGSYSIEKDKWINKPEKKKMSDASLHKDKIRKDVASYMDRIDEIEKNLQDIKDDDYKSRKLSVKIENLIKEIVKMRRDALKSAGKEMCDGNIVFKTLRRNGYLDKLFDFQTEAYDKEMSLNENGRL